MTSKNKSDKSAAQQKEKEKEDNAATAAESSAKVAALPSSTSMTSNNKCAWSVFRDCNPFLLAPIPCNVDGCTSTVHNICQVIWANKNKYDEQGTCTTTYCPEHHPAAPNIEQAVSTTTSNPSADPSAAIAASVAAVVVAATATTCQPPSSTANKVSDKICNKQPSAAASAAADTAMIGQYLPPPINMIINNITTNASPAESTLTGIPHVPILPSSPVPNLPPFSSDFPLTGGEEPMTIDDTGGVMLLNNDDNIPNEDDGDGDSYYASDEQQIHLLGVARRLANDQEGCMITSVADAERVLLSSTLYEDDIDDIDDDIGEPPTDAIVPNSTTALVGAPDGWNPPCPPPSFTGYQQKHNAPAEADIDNPARWSMFTFTPNFDSKNKYTYHTTPSGARVVRLNTNGKRQVNGWEFFYQDWQGDEFAQKTYARTGAEFGNLKPKSRKGCLDVDVLKKHGLMAARVRNDPMFFYQMIFPFCDPSESGVTNDHRMPYFSNATVCTNMYACWKGAGSGYGQEFPPVSIPELIKWTGVPICNGALDGKPSTLLHHWKEGDA